MMLFLLSWCCMFLICQVQRGLGGNIVTSYIFYRERRRFVHSMILYMYQRRWRLDMFCKSTHNAVNTVPFFVLIPNMILLEVYFDCTLRKHAHAKYSVIFSHVKIENFSGKLLMLRT